nr:hypothetical protein [Tanacetum cinerariifolium]
RLARGARDVGIVYRAVVHRCRAAGGRGVATILKACVLAEARRVGGRWVAWRSSKVPRQARVFFQQHHQRIQKARAGHLVVGAVGYVVGVVGVGVADGRTKRHRKVIGRLCTRSRRRPALARPSCLGRPALRARGQTGFGYRLRLRRCPAAGRRPGGCWPGLAAPASRARRPTCRWLGQSCRLSAAWQCPCRRGWRCCAVAAHIRRALQVEAADVARALGIHLGEEVGVGRVVKQRKVRAIVDVEVALQALVPVALGIYLNVVGPVRRGAIWVGHRNHARNNARLLAVDARFFQHAGRLIRRLRERENVATHYSINQEGERDAFLGGPQASARVNEVLAIGRGRLFLTQNNAVGLAHYKRGHRANKRATRNRRAGDAGVNRHHLVADASVVGRNVPGAIVTGIIWFELTVLKYVASTVNAANGGAGPEAHHIVEGERDVGHVVALAAGHVVAVQHVGVGVAAHLGHVTPDFTVGEEVGVDIKGIRKHEARRYRGVEESAVAGGQRRGLVHARRAFQKQVVVVGQRQVGVVPYQAASEVGFAAARKHGRVDGIVEARLRKRGRRHILLVALALVGLLAHEQRGIQLVRKDVFLLSCYQQVAGELGVLNIILEDEARWVAGRSDGRNLLAAVGVGIEAGPVRHAQPREEVVANACHVDKARDVAGRVVVLQVPVGVVGAGKKRVATRSRLVRVVLQVEAAGYRGQGAESTTAVAGLRGQRLRRLGDALLRGAVDVQREVRRAIVAGQLHAIGPQRARFVKIADAVGRLVVARERGNTPDVDVGRSTGQAAGSCDVHTRHLALQGIEHVGL